MHRGASSGWLDWIYPGRYRGIEDLVVPAMAAIRLKDLGER